MTDLTDKQVSFLETVFDHSFPNDASDRRAFRREELISLYNAQFGSAEGFSETADTLAHAKLIRVLPSREALNGRIEITEKGVDFLYPRDTDNLRPLALSSFKLSAAQMELLIADLTNALARVDDLALTQERRAQIRSLLEAARVLSEAPEPPISIIRELISRADRIINVAGFFLGVAGLILATV